MEDTPTNYLNRAKSFQGRAGYVADSEYADRSCAQVYATIAVASALIALVERLDKVTTSDLLPALRVINFGDL